MYNRIAHPTFVKALVARLFRNFPSLYQKYDAWNRWMFFRKIRLIFLSAIIKERSRFALCIYRFFLSKRIARMFEQRKKKLSWKHHTIKHIDPFYVSFIRRSQARLKCRERFTVKQVLGLIAAMILLLCINSVIVVTKSICYDTWGVVKLFNVYYKNNVLTCSPTSAFSSLLFASTRSVWLRSLIKICTQHD